MINSGTVARKVVAMSLLVLGYGAYDKLRASACNQSYAGRCYQWCSDGGVSISQCTVNDNDEAICYCGDGEWRKL